ncbi:MAG: ABC transporter ATP-binding protein [Clostridia bacterium]|nr:ABC transporter ATP-binding protein [Clostridia bacterium]
MLSVEGLTVRYGKRLAAGGVSLTVAEGEVVALIGHNGAGKTSVLRAVMGLVPAQGRVRLDGRELPPGQPAAAFAAGLRLVPQGGGVFPNLSVQDNLMLGSYAGRGEGADDGVALAHELFPVLRERAHQLAGTLSGGQQQMLAIAMALVSGPRFLMLDEPSLGLAPNLVERLMAAVRTIRETLGIGVLLVEQNLQQALAVTDRVYVMQAGQVVFQGDAAALEPQTLWALF